MLEITSYPPDAEVKYSNLLKMKVLSDLSMYSKRIIKRPANANKNIITKSKESNDIINETNLIFTGYCGKICKFAQNGIFWYVIECKVSLL